jgi:hypothetical protein
MSRRLSPVSLAAAGAIAASLLLTACGGSGGSGPNSSAAKNAEDALKFSRCMREHGVSNFPDPETSGGVTRFRGTGNVDLKVAPQKMEAAQNACKRYSPVEQVHLSPQEKVEREEAVQKFARCMREHGVKVETSTAGGGVGIRIHPGKGEGGPNPESPAFQGAQKACQGLLPGPKGGKGPGPGFRTQSGGPGGKAAGGPSVQSQGGG